MKGLGLILNGTEGVGKTSFAIEFERLGPVTFVSANETGFEDIMDYRTPSKSIVHHDADSYNEIVNIAKKVESGTFVLDALSGFQQFLFTHVCKTIYNGQWEGKGGFTSYYQGQRVDSPKVLEEFLAVLDNLRRKGVHVVLLSHVEIEETPNSLGADYFTYTLNLDKVIRGMFLKWAQAVIFMNIDANVHLPSETVGNKGEKVLLGKAADVDKRLMYVSKSPGHVAKNRELFDSNKPIIQMGSSSKTAFENFYKALPELFRKAWPLKNQSS